MPGLEFLKYNHDALTLILGAIGGFLALYRYFESERLARAKAASELIEGFFKNDTVKAAMRLIDWSAGSIAIALQGTTRTIKYDKGAFINALRSHGNGVIFTQDEQIIREVMDYFLSELERFDFLLERRVIDKRDFWSAFSYWLNLLGADPKRGYGSMDPERLKSLREYIQIYEFFRVAALLRRYELHAPEFAAEAKSYRKAAA